MKNQGREGGATDETMGLYQVGEGGGDSTNETMDLCEGVVGSQQIPWLSTGGGGGGGGGATEETVGLYRGEGAYRRDQGSLPGGSWVTADTMGLYKGEGGGGGGQNRYYGSSQGGWGAIRGRHHLHLFWWVLSFV